MRTHPLPEPFSSWTSLLPKPHHLHGPTLSLRHVFYLGHILSMGNHIVPWPHHFLGPTFSSRNIFYLGHILSPRNCIIPKPTFSPNYRSLVTHLFHGHYPSSKTHLFYRPHPFSSHYPSLGNIFPLNIVNPWRRIFSPSNIPPFLMALLIRFPWFFVIFWTCISIHYYQSGV